MIVYMKCVAEAIWAKGVRGLVEWVPGGPYLYDVAADAAKRLKERRRQEEIREELRQAAQASFEEAKAAAERVAREVAAAGRVEDRVALELYLSQVPGAVRKSMRRADDHTGRSVPAGFALDAPDDMLKVLPPQMPRFRTGQQLPGRPGWALLQPLGAGGFGEVWKAGHEFIPDVRAVKFCTDPAAKQRLLTHEGKLVARVMKEGRQPNVVPLVDADLTGETPWLAYEFVGGGDLAGLILSWQKLPIDERVERAVAALRVLADTAAHFHKLSPPIVHRDLKPANILLAPDGTLKITDFGIGGIAAQKIMSGSRDGATAYTRAVSMVAGAYTPIYASPQQQRGGPPDPRDDVHALGVIAFQMLTGRMDAGPGPRFERDLGKLGVPEWVMSLVGDCIDHEAENRPATGAALGSQLQKPTTRVSPSPLPTPPLAVSTPAPVAPPRPGREQPDEEMRKQLEADYAEGERHFEGRGVPRDYGNARQLFEKAARQGHAPAQCALGLLFLNGHGVPKDYATAWGWLEKAAAQGHAMAQHNLGFMCHTGQGIPQDYAQARAWFEKAAAQGNAISQYSLGVMCDAGDGGPRDFAQAIVWHKKAAEQNYYPYSGYSQYNLGVMYLDGIGVIKDVAVARAWLEKAAANNVAQAQFVLGELYEKGYGVAKDITQAMELYRKSAANGDEKAKKAVARLEKANGGLFRRLFGS